MRAHISIVLDNGSTYRGTADLALVSGSDSTEAAPSISGTQGVDFSLPVRPFMKRFGSNSTGPKKFTVLLAHMARGSLSEEVKRADIEAAWNRMSGILGGSFNGAYANRAKDFGWADSPKSGVYVLLSGWEAALT